MTGNTQHRWTIDELMPGGAAALDGRIARLEGIAARIEGLRPLLEPDIAPEDFARLLAALEEFAHAAGELQGYGELWFSGDMLQPGGAGFSRARRAGRGGFRQSRAVLQPLVAGARRRQRRAADGAGRRPALLPGQGAPDEPAHAQRAGGEGGQPQGRQRRARADQGLRPDHQQVLLHARGGRRDEDPDPRRAGRLRASPVAAGQGGRVPRAVPAVPRRGGRARADLRQPRARLGRRESLPALVPGADRRAQPRQRHPGGGRVHAAGRLRGARPRSSSATSSARRGGSGWSGCGASTSTPR